MKSNDEICNFCLLSCGNRSWFAEHYTWPSSDHTIGIDAIAVVIGVGGWVLYNEHRQCVWVAEGFEWKIYPNKEEATEWKKKIEIREESKGGGDVRKRKNKKEHTQHKYIQYNWST